MEFEYVNIEVDRYTVHKLISPEIEIAELDEHGYNYHDFVLIKYVNKKNVCEQVQLLAWKYKQSEKTICLIGCEKEDIECKYSSKINVVPKDCSNLFDLSFSCFSDSQYELLIDLCLGTRTGLLHGDPQDWRYFGDKRVGNSFALVSAFNNTYSQSMSDVCKQINMVKDINHFILAFMLPRNTLSTNEWRDYPIPYGSAMDDLMAQIENHVTADRDSFCIVVDAERVVRNYEIGLALIYQIKSNS